MQNYNCVLLVDDNDEACFLNEKLLKSVNFASHTHIATDGNNALNFVISNCIEKDKDKEPCPDLIFLDISMPGMDGFEFLEEFQSLSFNSKKPKIFMLSSSDHEQDIEKAKQFNADGYIVKPLTKNKLKALIES
jgi:CheY-like chemotaxis protein